MYIYHLTGWEHNYVLTNEKQYTQTEFESMCYEVTHDRYGHYNVQELLKYLKKKYDFKAVEYTAGFFTDGK